MKTFVRPAPILTAAGPFLAMIDRGFANDGALRRKYNRVLGNADVAITADQKDHVIGFGQTDAIHLKRLELLAAQPHSH